MSNNQALTVAEKNEILNIAREFVNDHFRTSVDVIMASISQHLDNYANNIGRFQNKGLELWQSQLKGQIRFGAGILGWLPALESVGGAIWNDLKKGSLSWNGETAKTITTLAVGISIAKALYSGSSIGLRAVAVAVGAMVATAVSGNWDDIWDVGDIVMEDFADTFKEVKELISNIPGISSLFEAAEAAVIPIMRMYDPLVLDLDGDGIELKAADGSAYFDLTGDGFATNNDWVSGDDAFLALDKNGNGTIDDINELFGSPEKTGFAELRELDSNNDGKINASDAQFSSLRVWHDANGDGITDTGELKTLADLDIKEISLNTTTVNTAVGN